VIGMKPRQGYAMAKLITSVLGIGSYSKKWRDFHILPCHSKPQNSVP